jgi:hypothetical protein
MSYYLVYTVLGVCLTAIFATLAAWLKDKQKTAPSDRTETLRPSRSPVTEGTWRSITAAAPAISLVGGVLSGILLMTASLYALSAQNLGDGTIKIVTYVVTGIFAGLPFGIDQSFRPTRGAARGLIGITDTNTNLEEVSTWLSKALFVFVLINLRELLTTGLDTAADSLSLSFGLGATSRQLTRLFIVTLLAIGFISGFLVSRRLVKIARFRP